MLETVMLVRHWVSVELVSCVTDGWLEFNVPFQHKYGYIRDESWVTLCN